MSRGPGRMVFAWDKEKSMVFAQGKEKGNCAVTLQHRFSVYFSGSSLGAGISFPPLRQNPSWWMGALISLPPTAAMDILGFL